MQLTEVLELTAAARAAVAANEESDSHESSGLGAIVGVYSCADYWILLGASLMCSLNLLSMWWMLKAKAKETTRDAAGGCTVSE